MKTTHLRILALLAGVAIFDFLFYMEAPGLNALLLVPVIFILVTLSGRNLLENSYLMISSAGLLLAGVAISLYSTAMSVLAYFGTFAIFLGFSLKPELTSIAGVMVQAGLNFFTAPAVLGSELSTILKMKKLLPATLKIIKIMVLPLILLFVFTLLYRSANPVFDRWMYYPDKFFRFIAEWLEKYLEIPHIIFILFATGLMTGIIYRGRHTAGLLLEQGRSEILERKGKGRFSVRLFPARILALKDEYRTGKVILYLMSALLLLVNTSELTWINGAFRDHSAPEMSQQVHEGTGLLIFSIVLSMIVMLYLFRKNLNFYPTHQRLTRGAGIWILLNVLLGLQVGVQNWFYVSQYGLTYKRIGVFFFLLFVVTGLVLLWIKINRRKTIWYLIKLNSMSFYVLFLAFSLVPWNTITIHYNLRPGAPHVDIDNALDQPSCALKTLVENRSRLISLNPGRKAEIESLIDRRISNFVELQENRGWKSKNLEDYLTFRFLKKNAAGTMILK